MITGFQGTYEGTCINCLTPTDTALGVRGPAEWHIAFLTHLGLPEDEATKLEEVEFGLVEDGQHDRIYRVCGDCARAARFPKPILIAYGAQVTPMVPA